MRFGWALPLTTSILVAPAAAFAREAATTISVGPGNLTDALASLAMQTGVSFGYSTPLPPIRVRGVAGRMTAHEAIDRLLRDTPIKAVRIGPNAYRIVARGAAPATRDHRRPVPSSPVPALEPPDIVVTGRKVPELLSRIPSPVAVFDPDDLPGAGTGADTGAPDVSHATDGFVVAGRGSGADRMFLRGMADSPFDGFSQTTVSVQVDDGRVTYDAPEPGLRLVDIARVEVLKGPQGPLYGTGALGGVYRIVTRRPVLGIASGSAALSLNTLTKGGPGGSAEGTINLPLIGGFAAVRVSGYASLGGGWIDNEPAPKDANRTAVSGARVALRIVPANAWSIDLSGMTQTSATRDSGYVYRAGRDLVRTVSLPEPSSTRFRLVQARVEGPIGRLQLVAATSQSWQRRSDVYDLSLAPGPLPVAGALAWRDARSYRVFDQELRVATAPGDRFTWTAGLSYLLAATSANGSAMTQSGQWVPYFALQRRASETAIFAAGSLPLSPRLTGSLGFRLFRTTIEDEYDEPAVPAASTRALTGFTPDLGLSYDLGPVGTIYARVSTAFRPGGLDPGSATGRYQADEVRNLDLGTRLRLGGRLTIDANVFVANWRDMQSDYLEPNGLIATRNTGDATIAGLETTIGWDSGTGWRVRGGLTLQRARLHRGPDGRDLPADRRLPLTPDIAAHATIERALTAGPLTLRPFAAVNFIGDTRLSFDDGLDRPMKGYATVRIGVGGQFGALNVRLVLDNLFDTRADTFAYGNPFTVKSLPQFTPLRPRAVSLTLSRQF